ncbi:MAG TPA: efflux transporter outer membrane subunit [Candidatus Cryptobacteroides pullicola]|nr:efflux transporter outer membrane subunit [Candidatus Cryptobacteroides pullicola]
MKKILASIITLPLLLAGCGIYTDYTRPALPVVDSLYTHMPVEAVSNDTTSLAFLSWEELFADSLLRGYIRMGLEHNTDLNLARLRVEEAEATLQASRLAFYPSASLSAELGASNAQGPSFSVAPSFQWEIDAFGKMRNTKKGAEAALEQSRAYRQAVQTQLIATIADSYYALLMLDQQMEISRRTMATWEENIRSLSALKRAGKTNEAAVLQASANKLQVENSIYSMQRQIYEQENAFAALLGTGPMEIRRGKLDDQSFPENLSVGIPLHLLQYRPDVRQAEYALAESFYAENLARSYFYPDITLGGSAGWSTSFGTAIGNPAGWLANALASLAAPLFDRGTSIARLKIAEAQQQEALISFRQTIIDAGTEVNNALAAWQMAKQRLNVDQKLILNLQAAVWNTNLLMKHGLTNYLEVLTAQQTLLGAELSQSSDKYAEIQSVINLYHALGGGSGLADD